MEKYIVALDQGTTSSRAIVFDKNQNILGVSQKEITQIYPKEGWVEHNPMEIWASQYGVLQEVMAKINISPKDIAAIGITNQRETTIVWDKNTGKPIYNAIVWQCRRTSKICYSYSCYLLWIYGCHFNSFSHYSTLTCPYFHRILLYPS